MKIRILSSIVLTAFCVGLFPSCMILDGGNNYRKKNKCCGIIKCDIHRKSRLKKHKRAVNAHKSLRKKEERIKRGW